MIEDAPLTLSQFLARFPWPAEMTADGVPLDWFWRFELAGAPEDLWPFLADTSRSNRALGLSPVQYVERDGALQGSTRTSGIYQEWHEWPWEWVWGRTLTCLRQYHRGLARWLRVIYLLEPGAAGGTDLHLYLGWIPRNTLSGWLLRSAARSVRAAYARVFAQLPAGPTGGVPAPYLRGSSLERSVAEHLRALAGGLASEGVAAELIERLADHLVNADELDLHRIQVRRLARAWSVDPHQLLRACLHATRIGLLELSWDVICPHCRGVRQEARMLGEVPPRGRCEACALEFGTDTETSVEITFHVHPAVRPVPRVEYCSAEPARKPHIKLHKVVPAGAQCQVASLLGPGLYRLRLRGETRYRYLEITAGSPASLSWRAGDDADLRGAAAPLLTLDNDTDRPQTFVLETTSWSDDALRPAHLFNLQEFRDLFSEQYVGSGVQLAVGSQTILFTDMVGSTRFYAQRGDAEAFVTVKAHFSAIRDCVAAHGGAVVKTIGDAVMAAFGEPVDALRAAHAIQERFTESGAGPAAPVRVRISLNTGPCIAVHLNSGIDYFGSTVNLAAKLQACADAGQIAMSQRVFEARGVGEYLRRVAASVSRLDHRLEALQQSLVVHRWDVATRRPRELAAGASAALHAE